VSLLLRFATSIFAALLIVGSAAYNSSSAAFTNHSTIARLSDIIRIQNYRPVSSDGGYLTIPCGPENDGEQSVLSTSMERAPFICGYVDTTFDDPLGWVWREVLLM
jgi:hypothetical protein